MDVQEKESVVRSFAQKQGVSYPILLDGNGLVSYQYGVKAHPAAYLIDTDGNLIGAALGYREWDRQEMKTLIKSLMARSE